MSVSSCSSLSPVASSASSVAICPISSVASSNAVWMRIEDPESNGTNPGSMTMTQALQSPTRGKRKKSPLPSVASKKRKLTPKVSPKKVPPKKQKLKGKRKKSMTDSDSSSSDNVTDDDDDSDFDEEAESDDTDDDDSDSDAEEDSDEEEEEEDVDDEDDNEKAPGPSTSSLSGLSSTSSAFSSSSSSSPSPSLSSSPASSSSSSSSSASPSDSSSAVSFDLSQCLSSAVSPSTARNPLEKKPHAATPPTPKKPCHKKSSGEASSLCSAIASTSSAFSSSSCSVPSASKSSIVTHAAEDEADDFEIIGTSLISSSPSTIALSQFLKDCGFHDAVDVEADGRCFFRVVRLSLIWLLQTIPSWRDTVIVRPTLLGVPFSKITLDFMPENEAASGEKMMILQVANILRHFIVPKWADEHPDHALAGKLATKYLMDDTAWVSGTLLETVAKETGLKWLLLNCVSCPLNRTFMLRQLEMYLEDGRCYVYGASVSNPLRLTSVGAFLAELPPMFQTADVVLIFLSKEQGSYGHFLALRPPYPTPLLHANV